MATHIGELVNAGSPPKMSSAQKVWEEAANGVAGMDRHAFVELMNGLWSGMGRTTMPDQTTLRVWYLCLSDLNVQQFGRAIQRYLTERSKEFVNVQLIRELSGAQQASEAKAVEAWQIALDSIRIVGSYARPAWDDPVISQTIANLGGWVEFCGQEPEQLRDFVRGRFLKTYESLAASGRVTQSARLVSLIDQSGSVGETVRVGYNGGHVARIGIATCDSVSLPMVERIID